MEKVQPKKHLGQHFLRDEGIAQDIVESLSDNSRKILEIGPGMGVLTKYLLPKYSDSLKVVEIDTESVSYLQKVYPQLQIIEGDFLKTDVSLIFSDSFSIIGNFPYNISSQILFKVYENQENIPEVVGMFQKEVAERVAAKPGNKTYGILSVLLGLYYDIEYLFTVHEHVFQPPPKVKSAVIRLTKNNQTYPDLDVELFTKVVKAGFNQRRKTLRNALSFYKEFFENVSPEYLSKRAEQLSVNEFIELTKSIQKSKKK